MSGRAAWLFSPTEDLVAFAAPVLLPLFCCVAASLTGALDRPVGPLTWLGLVVFVDVAHVYATIYRVYAVPGEVQRRPWLYLGLPTLCYALGVAFYAAGPLRFWRVLAYLAVFHFVRQQYGWLRMSSRRDRDLPRPGPGYARLFGWLGARGERWLDGAAIYAATVYPLLWWHLHLPRRFHWFVDGDFAAVLPPWLLPLGAALWAGLLLLWALRALAQAMTGGGVNLAKVLVLGGTYLTWYCGICLWDSDLAFTMTNVLAHGVPYLVVVFRYDQRRRASVVRSEAERRSSPDTPRPAGWLAPLAFYAPLALIAFAEEGVWDRLVWHEHGGLFPLAPVAAGSWLPLLVPLLALPQAAHYALDAWIWRAGPQNPDLAKNLGL